MSGRLAYLGTGGLGGGFRPQVVPLEDDESRHQADDGERRAHPERELEAADKCRRLGYSRGEQVVRSRGRHRDEDRQADGAADLLVRVDEPGCESCFTRLDPASAAIEIGTNEKPRRTPIRRKPGNRSFTYEPSTEIRVK